MPQNTKFEVSQRRLKIAELHLQGKPGFEIAQIVGVSPAQVCKDLKRISLEWKEKRIEDIDQVKSHELSKLDLMEKKAWSEYERSREVKTKKSLKKRGVTTNLGKTLGTDEKEQTFTEEQQLGDPRYLTIILECISKRAKIIGYEAAQKVSLGFSDMSDQQLNTYQSALLELKNKSNG